MTLNNLLETAAAAMSSKITTRSSPRVFSEVLPFRNGSIAPLAMMARQKKKKLEAREGRRA